MDKPYQWLQVLVTQIRVLPASGYCRQYPTPWRGTPRLLLSLLPPPVPSQEYQKLTLMKQEGETLILTGDVGSISLATQILAEPRPQDSTVKAPEQTTAK